MGHFDEIEPLPHVIAAVGRLRPDQSVRLVGLLRMRRNKGDGVADAAWLRWLKGVEPVLADVGARSEVVADASFVVIGDPEQWDRVSITFFPNPKAFLRFLSDERTIDLVQTWRAALEDVHMFVIGDPIRF